MAIEYVDVAGARIRIPRGWIILTLTLASWGLVSILGVAVWAAMRLLQLT